MTQNPKLLAAGLAGGYLLGRTRKAKVAMALASYVLGKRAGLSPQRLLTDGVKKLSETPEFARLNEQVREELMSAGRSVVTSAANRRLDSLSDTLRDRTDALSARDEEPQEDGEEAEEPDDRAAAEDEEEPEEPEEKQPARTASSEKSEAPPKKAAAKKTTARKPAAKKTASQSTRRR